MAQNAPPTPPTNVARAKNFLLYGFALSIALHLVLGPFLKFERTQAEEDAPQKVTVVKVPTPPPTPPPKATPPPKQNTPSPQQPKIKINTAKTESRSNTGPSETTNKYTSGNTQGVPQGQGTAAPSTAAPATPAPPTPTPSPTPASCSGPRNAEATTLQAATPDTPPIAQQQGITGTVQVIVSLDANSKIAGTSIQSSPSAVLNQAALRAARESTFRTRIVDCKPVADRYIFSVVFENQ